MSLNWTCPHCNSKTTINSERRADNSYNMTIDNSEGLRRLKTVWIVCPNIDCRKITLSVSLHEIKWTNNYNSLYEGSLIKKWNLLPNSFAKVYPDYIPKPLIIDYEEAYSIIELSPKASATLSRRCLQGIIRDFWGIKKARLVDEINALEEKIDPITWQSIDAVRKVGNIGAHMEKDINVIIEVEPNEARLLLQLIELLFEEWYIHKFEREKKLKAISGIAENKDNNKKQ